MWNNENIREKIDLEVADRVIIKNNKKTVFIFGKERKGKGTEIDAAKKNRVFKRLRLNVKNIIEEERATHT